MITPVELDISFHTVDLRPAEDEPYVRDVLASLEPDIDKARESLRRFLLPYVAIAKPMHVHYALSMPLGDVMTIMTLHSNRHIPLELIEVTIDAAFARVFRELRSLDETIVLTKRAEQVMSSVYADRLYALLNEKSTLWERFTAWRVQWFGGK